jgi:hypothetical protein
MPIPEAVLNQMKCCLLNDGHIAIEPIQLNCGANACRDCINCAKEEFFTCFSCKGQHEKKDSFNTPVNKLAETLLYSYLTDLFHYTETSLKIASDSIKGKILK